MNTSIFKVALVGHSQLPPAGEFPSISNCEISHYRFPGACIDDLFCLVGTTSFWNTTFDLTILCIVGNNLCKPDQTFQQFFANWRNLVATIKAKDKVLIPCSIEYRHYLPSNRFGVSPEEYTVLCKRATQKIKRFCAYRKIEYINLSMGRFPYTRNDGVHFSRHAQNKFVELIVTRIRRRMDN